MARPARKGSSRPASSGEGAPGPASVAAKAHRGAREAPRGPQGWRRWVLRLAVAALFPVLVLGGVEVGLRWMGFGYPTSFWIEDPGRGMAVDNDQSLWQFYSPETVLRPHPFAVPLAQVREALRQRPQSREARAAWAALGKP